MILTRRNFLAAPALLQAQRRKPNVVLLLPDQFRAQALGSMGDPNVRTPHMDRLASEGVRFTNTVANSPVCCPARAILTTGQYCHRNGMVANDLRLRESATGIASVLSGAGYRTGFVGKWHLDGGPRLPGFVPPGPRRHGFEFWAANQCSHQHFDTHYFRDTDQPIPIHKFEAEGWTDLGIEFLEASKRDTRPFFLNLFMGPPHDPYGAPKPYMNLYQPDKLKLRPNWASGEKIPGRAEIAAYYAAVTAVDDQVGRILKSLDDLGLADDTVVLLSSDHGDMLGSQGQRLKRKPWEESILVPGLLRYPRGAKGGRTDDLLFSHIDFMPTILGLCGVNQPVGLQGKDLSSVLLTGDGARPDSAFLQIFGPYDGDGTPEGWRGVRTSRYTYARFKNRPWVLYDNQADPYQQDNLAPDPAARKLLTQMDELTGRWMKSTGDAWSFNWTAKVEDAGRLYQERTFYTVDEYLRAQ
jgi:arylsulfatase A-like enzyme